MSYYDHACTDEFTEGQIMKMYDLVPQSVLHSTQEGCCDPTNDLHIYSDTTFQFDKYVGGDIFIHDQATLNIHKNLFLIDSQHIFVLSGGTLNIDGGHIQNCQSSNNWGGINLESNGSIITNNGTISGALVGISSKDGNTIIDISNDSGVNNCDIGIEINNDNTSLFTGYVNFNDMSITNCNVGLEIRDMPLITILWSSIQDCTIGISSSNSDLYLFRGLLSDNDKSIEHTTPGKYLGIRQSEFEDNFYDVVSNGSNLHVFGYTTFTNSQVAIQTQGGIGNFIHIENCSFDNIVWGYRGVSNVPNIDYKFINNYFSNYNIGFTSTSSLGSLNGWTIENNVFYSGSLIHGVRIIGNSNTEVLNNSFYTSDIDRSFSNTNIISALGSRGSQIDCNLLLGPNNVSINDDVRGIFLGGGNTNNISCNELVGQSFNINVSGISNEASIRGNLMGSASSGLLYGLWPSQGDALTGLQIHRGNEFYNFDSSFGAIHLSDDPDEVTSSLFIVDSLSNSNYFTNYDAVGPWFEIEISDSSFICSEVLCPQGVGSNINFGVGATGLNASLAEAGITTSHFGTSLTSSGRFYLFDLIDQALHNQISLHNDYQDFHNTFINEEIGKINNTIASLRESAEQFTTLKTSIGSIKNMVASLDTSASIVNAGSTEYEILKDSLAAHFSQYETLHHTYINVLSNARTTLSSISTTTLPMTNLKEVLLYSIAKELGMNPSSNNIYTIASQCPIEGGDAVFMAKGLLEINNGYFDYDDEDICRIAEGRSKAPQADVPLTIMPNPGTGQYSIIYPNGGDQLVIYNLMGNVIEKYDGFEKIKHIDISHLSQGFYKVVLLNEQGYLISTQTLIHLR